MKLSHFFLPHPETHSKAHLISSWALAVYLVLFLLLYSGIKTFTAYKPGVLGVESSISQQELIRLTNVERQKHGLAPVSEDSRLNTAALEKAKNMFEENYWAHYAPSGKDPWGFINGAGYKFTYAGENLAKSFYKSDEVVDAWMASRTHKENILNKHYKNIGIAVLEGTLNGEKTTLVVQEFGSPVDVAVAQAPNSQMSTGQVPAVQSIQTPNLNSSTGQAEAEESGPSAESEEIAQAPTTASSSQVQSQTLVASEKQTFEDYMTDPYFAIKAAGFSLLFILFILLVVDLFVDLYILRKRAVYKITSRHLPHLALISVSASVLFNLGPGQIL
jgi:uncharacterized protein YkwD